MACQDQVVLNLWGSKEGTRTYQHLGLVERRRSWVVTRRLSRGTMLRRGWALRDFWETTDIIRLSVSACPVDRNGAVLAPDASDRKEQDKDRRGRLIPVHGRLRDVWVAYDRSRWAGQQQTVPSSPWVYNCSIDLSRRETHRVQEFWALPSVLKVVSSLLLVRLNAFWLKAANFSQ